MPLSGPAAHKSNPNSLGQTFYYKNKRYQEAVKNDWEKQISWT
jgi:hypothetical protein